MPGRTMSCQYSGPSARQLLAAACSTGVKPAPRTRYIHTLRLGQETENVFPYDAEFRYDPDGAEVVIEADGEPVLLTHGCTALFNSAVSSIGRDSFAEKVEYVRESISLLLLRAATDTLRALTDPDVWAQSCGLTHFEDTEGRELLLAVDYSPYDGIRLSIHSLDLNTFSHKTILFLYA